MRYSLLRPARRVALLAPALTAVTLAACAADVAPAELPGLYVMNRGRAADSLWLQPGGRYVHRYVPPAGAAAVDSGGWEVEPRRGNELRVTLTHFVSRSDAETWPVSSPSLRPGYWSTYTERASGGRPALVVNDDLGWAFVRVAGPQ